MTKQSTLSFNKIKSFALNNDCANELTALLFELQEKWIININEALKKFDFNFSAGAINEENRNFRYFYKNMAGFCLQ